MAWEETLIRMGAALLFGSLIGFERQWNQKMAGLRTNALVSLGAAGFVVYSSLYPIAGDPTRVAAQIVSGIGFLGAGVILRDGFNVHGINTAATLWCSAMVGTFAGGGFIVPSAIAAGFVVVTNICLRPVVSFLNRRLLTATSIETHYVVEITCASEQAPHIRSQLLHALAHAGLSLRRINSEDIPDTENVMVKADAVSATRIDHALELITGRLSQQPTVSSATWLIDHSVHET